MAAVLASHSHHWPVLSRWVCMSIIYRQINDDLKSYRLGNRNGLMFDYEIKGLFHLDYFSHCKCSSLNGTKGVCISGWLTKMWLIAFKKNWYLVQGPPWVLDKVPLGPHCWIQSRTKWQSFYCPLMVALECIYAQYFYCSYWKNVKSWTVICPFTNKNKANKMINPNPMKINPVMAPKWR